VGESPHQPDMDDARDKPVMRVMLGVDRMLDRREAS
jgi:hypothetical protein